MPFLRRLSLARTRVMTVSTYIGTSGWHYDHWEGPFYPTGLPDNSFLEYYASCFYRGRYGIKRLVGWANVFSAWRLEGENPFRAAQQDKIEHMMLVTLLNEREYELH